MTDAIPTPASPARSATGTHVLLPAFHRAEENVPIVTKESLISWTFGRGTVIWRVWPAVLLHTIFALGASPVPLSLARAC
ncbi:hypothetical protein C8Q76DRAFT_763801 [Earliella scabrosa]|nr:hypothetical protein C8Q76DRAFT_763801 [Earliella scabrosa]